eukprot:scaffold138525_cov22-Tisochrysis_lutea.AAC.1
MLLALELRGEGNQGHQHSHSSKNCLLLYNGMRRSYRCAGQGLIFLGIELLQGKMEQAREMH